MAYAAVNSLLKTIDDIVNCRRISVAPASSDMAASASQQLKSLLQALKRLDHSSKSNSRNKVNALDAHIKDAVWKFEDLLKSHVYHQILPQSQSITGDGQIQIHLEDLRHDVHSFIKMLKEKEQEFVYELDNPLAEEEEAAFDASTQKFKMVGSSDILRDIKEKLKSESCCYFVPVLGMGGIGKTTIAREIFDDPLVMGELNFEARAWVTIGKNFQLQKVIRDILMQLDPDAGLEGGFKNELRCLKRFLKAKRCLIVLDDVWDKTASKKLKSSLEHGRGHVVVTTRLRDACGDVRDVFRVELLSRDESWDLLRQRVFGDGSCPLQFIKPGKKIAEKCDGLPLMIITVAGLLSEAGNDVECWEKVADDKRSSLFVAAYDQLCTVLLPSYEYLPQHLKPCFLHVGVFPQDYNISRSKLVNMWVIEGFLEPNNEQTMEDRCNIYLGKLIDHSVLLTCQTSSNDRYQIGNSIKVCRLHSTFWHLCNREARNNKFFCVLSSRGDCLQTSMGSQRRLSVQNNILLGMNDVFDYIEESCASSARSFLCYGHYHPYPVPICFKLRLLEILDALRIRFYEFPIPVLQLVYLRYLSLTYNGHLPVSISRLWNLHVLIIHRNTNIKSSGVASYVPIEIWDMKELKHIQIMGRNIPNPSSSGATLESLSTLTGVGAETCTREVLRRIPNLRKLGVHIELHPDDDMRALHCLNHVHVLHKLESLKCVVVNPWLRSEMVALPAPLSRLPSRLRKLHLSGLGYPWEYMNMICDWLRDLQVLKLRCYAFRGPKWEIDSGVLQSIRHLVIDGTDLVQFKVVGVKIFMESMCFRNCYRLQHIEWGSSLHYPSKIEVIDCSPSAVNFANEMRSLRSGSIKEARKIHVQSSWEDKNHKLVK